MAESLITDKTELLSKVTKSAAVLKKADPKLLENKTFMLEAVAANPCAIKYAAKTLIDDKKFIIKILSDNGLVYRYLPTELKCDGDIIVAAIKNTLEVVPFVSEKALKSLRYYLYSPTDLKNRNLAIFLIDHCRYADALKYFNDDKDIALYALEKAVFGDKVFGLLSPKLRSDKEFLKYLYLNKRYIFDSGKYNKERELIASDREVVIQAMKDSKMHPFLEERWSCDKEIVLLAVSMEPRFLAKASATLRDDVEVVRTALTKNGYMLSEASDRLKDDRDIVALAVSNSGNAIQFASDRLKNDFDIVCMAGEQYASSVHSAGELICDNEDYVKILHTKYQPFAQYMSDRLKDNKDFALELIALDPIDEYLKVNSRDDILRYLSDRLRNDKEIVAACVFEKASEFDSASEELKHDRDFILEILTNLQVDISRYLPNDFILDLEIQAAIRNLSEQNNC